MFYSFLIRQDYSYVQNNILIYKLGKSKLLSETEVKELGNISLLLVSNAFTKCESL